MWSHNKKYKYTYDMRVDTLSTGRTYFTPDGEYPSITTILGKTANNVWLQAWKDKERQIGQVIHWNILTSPLSGFPGAEAVSYLRYGHGIDKVQEIIQQAIDFSLIDVSGAWYSLDFAIDSAQVLSKFLEEKEVSLEDEKSLRSFFKLQGQVKLKAFLEDNPPVLDLLEETLRDILL